jgi:hypothetical protein
MNQMITSEEELYAYAAEYALGQFCDGFHEEVLVSVRILVSCIIMLGYKLWLHVHVLILLYSIVGCM